MQTQAIMKWCRTCGLSSPMRSGCLHCSDLTQEKSHYPKKLNTKVQSDNCGMVQNNVLNIDSFDMGEEPIGEKPSSFHRFFMVTCSIAMWLGISVMALFLVFFISILVVAFMKMH